MATQTQYDEYERLQGVIQTCEDSVEKLVIQLNFLPTVIEGLEEKRDKAVAELRELWRVMNEVIE